MWGFMFLFLQLDKLASSATSLLFPLPLQSTTLVVPDNNPQSAWQSHNLGCGTAGPSRSKVWVQAEANVYQLLTTESEQCVAKRYNKKHKKSAQSAVLRHTFVCVAIFETIPFNQWS